MAAHASEGKWWSKDTLAVVTGANKGIGYEVAKQLAEQGVSVILTARDVARGSEAARALSSTGLNVTFHVLEVGNKDSTRQFVDWLKQEHGGLDILVNNAGVTMYSSSAEEVMNVNYWGTVWLTRELLPLFKPSPAGARIVNVTSLLAKLQYLNNEGWRKRLADTSNLDQETLDSFAAEYIQLHKPGTAHEWSVGDEAILEGHDYPEVSRLLTPYHASKQALNAFTRLLAKDPALHTTDRKIYVNSVHPGYVKTDMSPRGPVALPEGADTIVWLALLAAGGPTAGFFFQRKDYTV